MERLETRSQIDRAPPATPAGRSAFREFPFRRLALRLLAILTLLAFLAPLAEAGRRPTPRKRGTKVVSSKKPPRKAPTKKKPGRKAVTSKKKPTGKKANDRVASRGARSKPKASPAKSSWTPGRKASTPPRPASGLASPGATSAVHRESGHPAAVPALYRPSPAGAPAAEMASAPTSPPLPKPTLSTRSKGGSFPLDVKWKDGLRFESPDKSMSLRIGGRLHYDWSFFDANPSLEQRFGPLEGGSEFRRARLQVSGTIYDSVEFKTEYDFAHGESAFKDVYVGVVDLPILDSVYFGYMKEPMSLEELTSDSSGTFVERSNMNLFAPSRSGGAMFHVGGARAQLAGGLFKITDEFGDAKGESFDAWTARFSGAPWIRKDGTGLLHLGISYSRRNPNEETIRYRARPEIHLSPRFLDTGDVSVERVDLAGLEAALVTGPVSLQGELMTTQVWRPDAPKVLFSGWYVQGSWILTGESRGYKAEDGEFKGVRPNRNFAPKERGWGAFELAARWSRLVLSDRDVRGGSMNSLTIGFNWYLNPQSRFMLDLARTEIEDVGDSDTLAARYQVDF